MRKRSRSYMAGVLAALLNDVTSVPRINRLPSILSIQRISGRASPDAFQGKNNPASKYIRDFVDLKAGSGNNASAVWYHTGIMRNPVTGNVVAGIEGLEFVRRIDSATVAEIESASPVDQSTRNEGLVSLGSESYLSDKIFVYVNARNRSEPIISHKLSRNAPSRIVNPVRRLHELVTIGFADEGVPFARVQLPGGRRLSTSKIELLRDGKSLSWRSSPRRMFNKASKGRYDLGKGGKGKSMKYSKDSLVSAPRKTSFDSISSNTGRTDPTTSSTKETKPKSARVASPETPVDSSIGASSIRRSFNSAASPTPPYDSRLKRIDVVNFMSARRRKKPINKWISFANPTDTNGRSQEYYSLYGPKLSPVAALTRLPGRTMHAIMRAIPYRIVLGEDVQRVGQFFRGAISNTASRVKTQLSGADKLSVGASTVVYGAQNLFSSTGDRTRYQREKAPAAAFMHFRRYGEAPPWYAIHRPSTIEITSYRYASIHSVPVTMRVMINDLCGKDFICSHVACIRAPPSAPPIFSSPSSRSTKTDSASTHISLDEESSFDARGKGSENGRSKSAAVVGRGAGKSSAVLREGKNAFRRSESDSRLIAQMRPQPQRLISRGGRMGGSMYDADPVAYFLSDHDPLESYRPWFSIITHPFRRKR